MRQDAASEQADGDDATDDGPTRIRAAMDAKSTDCVDTAPVVRSMKAAISVGEPFCTPRSMNCKNLKPKTTAVAACLLMGMRRSRAVSSMKQPKRARRSAHSLASAAAAAVENAILLDKQPFGVLANGRMRKTDAAFSELGDGPVFTPLIQHPAPPQLCCLHVPLPRPESDECGTRQHPPR